MDGCLSLFIAICVSFWRVRPKEVVIYRNDYSCLSSKSRLFEMPKGAFTLLIRKLQYHIFLMVTNRVCISSIVVVLITP